MRARQWLVLLGLLGCEKIVGIEDLRFVNRDGGDDDGTTDASSSDARSDAPLTCSDSLFQSCTPAGLRSKNDFCFPDAGSTCQCGEGLRCIYGNSSRFDAAGLAFGACCPPDVACAPAGTSCTENCECKNALCQAGICQ